MRSDCNRGEIGELTLPSPSCGLGRSGSLSDEKQTSRPTTFRSSRPLRTNRETQELSIVSSLADGDLRAAGVGAGDGHGQERNESTSDSRAQSTSSHPTPTPPIHQHVMSEPVDILLLGQSHLPNRCCAGRDARGAEAGPLRPDDVCPRPSAFLLLLSSGRWPLLLAHSEADICSLVPSNQVSVLSVWCTRTCSRR